MSIHIRLAQARDAPAIAALLYEAFAEYRACYTPAAFSATTPTATQIQSRLSEGPVWVACNQAVLVGTISAVAHDAGLYLRSLAVLPSAQGCGVGRSLVEHAEQCALAHGYQCLLLSTTPFLIHAIGLYKQLGFQLTDAGPHQLYGTALVTMVKPIVPLGLIKE